MGRPRRIVLRDARQSRRPPMTPLNVFVPAPPPRQRVGTVEVPLTVRFLPDVSESSVARTGQIELRLTCSETSLVVVCSIPAPIVTFRVGLPGMAPRLPSVLIDNTPP